MKTVGHCTCDIIYTRLIPMRINSLALSESYETLQNLTDCFNNTFLPLTLLTQTFSYQVNSSFYFTHYVIHCPKVYLHMQSKLLRCSHPQQHTHMQHHTNITSTLLNTACVCSHTQQHTHTTSHKHY
jgi:hypothetical protein